MIIEADREEFLSTPERYALTPRIAVAAVAVDGILESDALEMWDFLKGKLNGVGIRVGYRAFLALLEDTEDQLRDCLHFLRNEPNQSELWRLVAAPLPVGSSFPDILRGVEWRAHKAVQHKGELLTIVGCEHAPLQECPEHTD